VILEHSLPTTPKGIHQVFSSIPRSRSALETGTHSPWVSRQMLQDINAAAAKFQKYIDRRGVVLNFPWGALARPGRAHVYAVQGDTAEANAAYEEFLTRWKDADPDIPILKQAKAEYAKLK
jgi:hypothetical protein